MDNKKYDNINDMPGIIQAFIIDRLNNEIPEGDRLYVELPEIIDDRRIQQNRKDENGDDITDDDDDSKTEDRIVISLI